MKIGLYDWCIQNNRTDIIDRWDCELNTIDPRDISVYSKEFIYLKCAKGIHKSSMYQIASLPKHNSKLECKYCLSFEYWCTTNDRQDLLDRWDYELNRIAPEEVARTSPKIYYFKCPRGLHSSTGYKLNNLTKYSCSEAKCFTCNSFAQWGIDNIDNDFLNKYWDYEKNININPWKIPYCARATTTIYIKCQYDVDHKSYKTFPSHFVSGSRCPECCRVRTESYLQEAVRLYLENNYDYPLSHEYNCSIIAYNSLSKHYMPYDNDLQINNIHLIIETHGKQHYEVTQLTHMYAEREGISDVESLRYQQYRDKYKKDYALSFNGYYYLELSYKTIKNESFKTLIDNKIHEILTLTQQNN